MGQNGMKNEGFVHKHTHKQKVNTPPTTTTSTHAHTHTKIFTTKNDSKKTQPWMEDLVLSGAKWKDERGRESKRHKKARIMTKTWVKRVIVILDAITLHDDEFALKYYTIRKCGQNEWVSERAEERRHPPKWNSKVAATAPVAQLCVLKNYIACAVLHNGWIAFLSEISMNMSIIKIIFKAKITEKCEHLRFCEETPKIPWHSIRRECIGSSRISGNGRRGAEKLLTLAVSSSFYQENEVLELQFSCLRELLAYSLLRSFVHSCLCFYL